MNERLYRGKMKDNGEWVEGYYCGKVNRTFFSPPEDSAQIIDKYLWWHEVIPETVEQETGFTDKNGKKIFEGDIVKHFNGIGIGLPDVYEICEIRWNKKDARFESIHRDKKSFLISNEAVYEVIGNIHDNPELLKGGADNG